MGTPERQRYAQTEARKVQRDYARGPSKTKYLRSRLANAPRGAGKQLLAKSAGFTTGGLSVGPIIPVFGPDGLPNGQFMVDENLPAHVQIVLGGKLPRAYRPWLWDCRAKRKGLSVPITLFVAGDRSALLRFVRDDWFSKTDVNSKGEVKARASLLGPQFLVDGLTWLPIYRVNNPRVIAKIASQYGCVAIHKQTLREERFELSRKLGAPIPMSEQRDELARPTFQGHSVPPVGRHVPADLSPLSSVQRLRQRRRLRFGRTSKLQREVLIFRQGRGRNRLIGLARKLANQPMAFQVGGIPVDCRAFLAAYAGNKVISRRYGC